MEQRFQQPPDWQWKNMTEQSGLRLRTGSLIRHENPVANLIIGPGMREFCEKYFETIQDFSKRGYNIFFINWMGQGGSQSILPGRFHRAAGTFDFHHDADNLLDFANNHVPDGAPKIYLGHSTGGLIGLLAMAKAPKAFAATVLLVPFLGLFDRRAKFLEATLKFLNLSPKALQRYAPGGKDWLPRNHPQSNLKPEAYSSDPVRMSLSDEWTIVNPELQVGDLTLGGFQEAYRAIASLEQPGIAEAMTTPTLLFSAGLEKIVSTARIFNMATQIPGAAHIHLDNACHETHLERDEIRDTVIGETDNFFRRILG